MSHLQSSQANQWMSTETTSNFHNHTRQPQRAEHPALQAHFGSCEGPRGTSFQLFLVELTASTSPPEPSTGFILFFKAYDILKELGLIFMPRYTRDTVSFLEHADHRGCMLVARPLSCLLSRVSEANTEAWRTRFGKRQDQRQTSCHVG